MKKIFLLNVLLAMSLAADAQNDSTGYTSIFGRESTEWRGATVFYDSEWDNYTLRASSDTVKDGKIYKKIECFFRDTIRHPEEDFLLREDTVEGKAWIRLLLDSIAFEYLHIVDTDYLIMDMNLQLGDSILLLENPTHLPWPNIFYVTGIEYNDSLKTIHLNSDIYDYKYVHKMDFIEGVGSPLLFDMLINPHIQAMLLCCHKDGEHVYTKPYEQYYDYEYYVDCIIPQHGNIGELNESEKSPLIYPNPCSDWITIDMDNILSAILLDIHGKIVASASESHSKIDVSRLPSGVYLLRVVQCDNIIARPVIKK